MAEKEEPSEPTVLVQLYGVIGVGFISADTINPTVRDAIRSAIERVMAEHNIEICKTLKAAKGPGRKFEMLVIDKDSLGVLL